MPSTADVKREIARRELSRRNLSDFYTLTVWPIIEPSTRYIHSWGMDAINDVLMAAYNRQLRKIIINIQPRIGKSNLVSVSFPLWAWLKDPALRFMFFSHDNKLCYDFSGKRRVIMSHPYYRSLLRTPLVMIKDIDSAQINDQLGCFKTASSRNATGKGCNFLILDDVHSIDDALSDTVRTRQVDRVQTVLYSRLDDRKRDVIIQVSQRSHIDDITGAQLKEHGYYHLKIPTEEPQDRYFVFPYSGKTVTLKKGDILCPERTGEEEITSLKQFPLIWFTQYQQEPSVEGGEILKDAMFPSYDTIGKVPIRIMSIDSASKDQIKNDFWSIDLYGTTDLDKEKPSYLLDHVHQRFTYPDGKSFIETKIALLRPQFILIEDQTTGSSLLQELPRFLSKYRMNIQLIPIRHKHNWSKIVRAAIAAGPLTNGKLFVPTPKNCSWVLDWIKIMLDFPNGTHDDPVDSMSQYMIWAYILDIQNKLYRSQRGT